MVLLPLEESMAAYLKDRLGGEVEQHDLSEGPSSTVVRCESGLVFCVTRRYPGKRFKSALARLEDSSDNVGVVFLKASGLFGCYKNYANEMVDGRRAFFQSVGTHAFLRTKPEERFAFDRFGALQYFEASPMHERLIFVSAMPARFLYEDKRKKGDSYRVKNYLEIEEVKMNYAGDLELQGGLLTKLESP